PALYGKRRVAPAHYVWAQAQPLERDADPDRLSGHGRARHALSAALDGKDRGGELTARRAARPSLDGRYERRLFLLVPDRHAQHRHASTEGNGGRAVLGL